MCWASYLTCTATRLWTSSILWTFLILKLRKLGAKTRYNLSNTTQPVRGKLGLKSTSAQLQIPILYTYWNCLESLYFLNILPWKLSDIQKIWKNVANIYISAPYILKLIFNYTHFNIQKPINPPLCITINLSYFWFISKEIEGITAHCPLVRAWYLFLVAYFGHKV